MNNKELVNKALGICHTLTYNTEPEGSAKHVIRELAHRLDRARELSADEVAWILASIGRRMGGQHVEALKYDLLYDIMNVAGFKFADEAARNNAIPRVVFALGGVKLSGGDRAMAAANVQSQCAAGSLANQP